MDYRELCCEHQVAVGNSRGEGWGFCKGGLGDSSNPDHRQWSGGYFVVEVFVAKMSDF